MSNEIAGYYGGAPAAYAPSDARISFIQRTYTLLGLSILVFAGIEAALIESGLAKEFVVNVLAPFGKAAWLGLMVLFIGGGYLAQYMARSQASRSMQYMGLALYVGIEVVIFLPILTLCSIVPSYAELPLQAGILTATVFGGLTAVVFISKKDFSFLGYGIMVASFLAMGLIIVALITGLSLGAWFSAAMIALACAAILYDTSNVLKHYPTDAHVPAALELFASVALLYYYILRLLMQFTNR